MCEIEKEYGEYWLSNNYSARPLKYEVLPNGCHRVIDRRVDREGRCIVFVNRTSKLAHRAVWEFYNGEIPDNLCILHSCDFGGCINIEHMRLGTKAENNRERSERGRNRVYTVDYVEPDMRFTINCNANHANPRTLDVKINRKTGCWEVVNRVPTPEGYYRVKYKQKTLKAHRFMYERFNGTIPKGYVVRHKCNNLTCVAPHHLTIGTQKDNAEDRVKSGRSAKGSTNGSSKLNELQALFIRVISPAIRNRSNREAIITQTEVGKWFGVSHVIIGDILRNESWTHLPNHEEIREIVRELDVS